MSQPGKVYLIGAGPGDPGLVTVRARELIELADVIVYDYLANPKLLDWAKPAAEKIYVGKRSGMHSIPQDEIEEILVDRAHKGLQVVRLKGGDPFVFGRGGEEASELQIDKIPFEIVPGVTAALAAAAYAGIPLSHRDFSSSITFLTGHENPEKHTLSIDFKLYGKTNGTLCLYMSVGQLPRIIKELKAGGMSGEMPVGIIQWATLSRQKSVYGTIDSILEDIEQSGIGTPAMIIIGQVVAHRAKTEWFEGRPLFGKRIVVTRAREQAGQLSQILSDQGAEVIELPFISVQQHFDAKRLGEVFAGIAVYEWIIFTSANGVKNFFDLFYKAYDDIRCLGPMRIAAVGAATAREIEKHKLKVDLIPQKANADALADELIENEGIESVQILVITGNLNRENLVKRLESDEGRAIVDTLPLYKTTKTDLSQDPAAERFRQEGADAVLFTSSSTVKSFVDQHAALTLEPDARKPVFGSIGPLTTQTLKDLKLPVAFEATQASLEHFVVETISHLNSEA
ncbi:uroporphyrinogen-III C-methyltransferase [Coraliomargarita sp. SDUM461004]|uniref:uroporphyrinogen-III C-methyltransferase n=1 Tax=Thalassobacterium sedimentorum TaxID=3041258 RepID=A0ABU1AHV4_9BACT|nr:uroporphyrinogen-III C-methyltransferase [Coraliomargarita sp. SDUM461004]MDQ8194272.1 uroporphyrinogen-III C-methyltransferase [Coraliomargarita sp. SDUM461004]